MRIVTDGKRFAVAKGRWFWTRFLDRKDEFWWFADSDYTYYAWFDTKEEAKHRMETYVDTSKHWDVKE